MSKRDYRLLLEDMLEAIHKIEVYTNKLNFQQFKNDSKTVDAVIRNLEIIGEAANQVPVEYQKKYENISWRRIVGLRNRIIHEYFGVDLEIIWKIVSEDIIQLKREVQNILSS